MDVRELISQIENYPDYRVEVDVSVYENAKYVHPEVKPYDCVVNHDEKIVYLVD